MSSIKHKRLAVHVDVDSPRVLLNFYNLKGINFDEQSLTDFYEITFDRILGFFKGLGIKATFFVVGNEIEKNETVRKVVLRAFNEGHEIENHTYSHPHGLAELSPDIIKAEIITCSDIIENLTGQRPKGFRSPGFSINNQVINLLAENNFSYDSSGFWSVMNPILKSSHKLLFKNGLKNAGFGMVTSKLKQRPYKPDTNNWLNETGNGLDKAFWELPLPRSNLFALPFYHNINLWAPSLYSSVLSKTISRPVLVYLFHIIKFADLYDNVPKELKVHPNLRTPLKNKLNDSKTVMENLLKRYENISTHQLLEQLNSQS